MVNQQKAISVAGLLVFGLLAAPALASGKTDKVMAFTDAPACAPLPDGVDEKICVCAEGFSKGSVWGSGPYTGDSSICTAAVHAGVLGPKGGAVKMTRKPGQEKYEGSEQNGVTTNTWGSYGQSFDVLSVLVSGEKLAVAAPACARMPSGVDRLTCSCAPGQASGSIWGTGTYTGDSDICTAARHAGAVDQDGGTITVRRADGLSAYEGSEANGVTSSSWGSYDSSIVFGGN